MYNVESKLQVDVNVIIPEVQVDPLLPVSEAALPLVTGSVVPDPLLQASGSAVPLVIGSVVPDPLLPASGAAVPLVTGSVVPDPLLPASGAAVPLVTGSVVPDPLLPASGAAVPLVTGSVFSDPLLPASGAALALPVMPDGPLACALLNRLVSAALWAPLRRFSTIVLKCSNHILHSSGGSKTSWAICCIEFGLPYSLKQIAPSECLMVAWTSVLGM